jgi:effector-binding domain-containing protein
MLPVISEEIAATAFNEIFENMPEWRKRMIHYIKDENPEVNTAIIEAANKTNLDPKAVALGAYMTYLLIELAVKENDEMMNYTE